MILVIFCIPFVFVTASAQREEIRIGLELGADDYITKPFDSEELCRIVRLKIGVPGTA
jgi:DNA-binding response OmpR family regulator